MNSDARFSRRGAFERNPLEPFREAAKGIVEHADEHAVLAAEVMLHGAPRHAGAARDLRRRGPRQPDLGDALDHRVHQAGARLRRALGVRAARLRARRASLRSG